MLFVLSPLNESTRSQRQPTRLLELEASGEFTGTNQALIKNMIIDMSKQIDSTTYDSMMMLVNRLCLATVINDTVNHLRCTTLLTRAFSQQYSAKSDLPDQTFLFIGLTLDR